MCVMSDVRCQLGSSARSAALFIAVATFELLLPRSVRAQTAFEAATRGAVCTQNVQGSRLCHYKIGRNLEISIAGVGEGDAGISILRSSIDGDFYARFAVLHGCVIVAAGNAAPPAATTNDGLYAFISPRDGKIYKTWQDCAGVRQPRERDQ
jgi:hypothetical protein